MNSKEKKACKFNAESELNDTGASEEEISVMNKVQKEKDYARCTKRQVWKC